jgi:hypothetical protein
MTRFLLSALAFFAASTLPLGPARAMCIPFPCDDCELLSRGQMNLVVFDRDAGRIKMVPNIRITGDAADFALVVPTPGLPTLSPASSLIWTEATALTAPLRTRGFSSGDGGLGCQSTQFAAPTDNESAEDRSGVIVHDRVAVGAFIATILSSDDPEALVGWLNRHNYDVTSEEAAALAPFVARGWFFTTMKLDTSIPAGQRPASGWDNNVDPVLIEYEGDDLEVPLAILDVNRAASLPMVFYVVDDHRAALEGFQTFYANRFDESEHAALLGLYPNLGEFVAPGRFLSRLDRTFQSTDAMAGSITIGEAATDDEFRRTTNSSNLWGAIPGDWLLLGLVPWMLRRMRSGDRTPR